MRTTQRLSTTNGATGLDGCCPERPRAGNVHRGLRGGVLALLLVTAVMGAIPAAAAPAVKESYRYAFFDCLAETTDGGTAMLVVAKSRRNTDVYVARWAPGADPLTEEPLGRTDSGQPAFLSWDGDRLSGTTDLYAFDVSGEEGPLPGEKVDTATWEVTAGLEQPLPYESHDRDGNQVRRQSGSEGTPTVEGRITFSDGAFAAVDASTCPALYLGENSVFENAPAVVLTERGWQVGTCVLSEDDRTVVVSFDEGDVFVGEWAAGADPELDRPLRAGVGEAEMGEGLIARVPMELPGDEGGTPAGEAEVRLSWTVGPPRTQVLRYPGIRERLQLRALTITGTVLMPGEELALPVSGCHGERGFSQLQLDLPSVGAPGAGGSAAPGLATGPGAHQREQGARP